MAKIDLTDSEEEFAEDSEDYRPLSLKEWARDILISWGPAIFAVFFIRSVIAEPFRIPSGSMVPTLEIGDHILVTKYSYGFKILFDATAAKEITIAPTAMVAGDASTIAKAINDTVGIEQGSMTTIHAYTNDQNLSDVYHPDLYRARSATQSMIPTKTGAAKAVGLVLPELAGKLDGMAVRVPTINVSLVDLTFIAKRDTSIEEINQVVKDAAFGSMKGILEYNELPLVSIDFNHNPASSIFDATLTKVSEGTLVKVCSWYDNEWGFSNRMLDTTVALMTAA